jgi:lactococcus lactis bacteriophage major capsid protein|uniref:Major capsid protein n=2 Tax=unclassified Caudoviricetes TaxID=2788787 RepID=A0A8S5Q7V0_9CAUD|nr:MAG TPA: major capsid protein [Siphoviridae sp. cta8k49]DAE14813.1 MAG TPA: major capsid protein [Siphoviridae sp. ctM0g22]
MKFWKWSNSVLSNNQELILDGPIASDTWWGDEVTPDLFREELKQHAGDLTVVINSPGGDVFAGLAIYNALVNHNGNVTVRVDGLAASIASVIAMAGDKIIMSPGSMIMIHRPSVYAAGTVDDMEKAKDVLMKIEEGITPIYAKRTGLSDEKIAELLEAETWMLADKAVELGFADEVSEAPEKQKQDDGIQNAMGMNFAFSMSAVKQADAKPMQSLVEQIKAKAEAEAAKAAEPAEETTTESETKTDEAAAPEAAPEAEPTDEAEQSEPKESTNNNPEEDTEMDPKDIAKMQIKEPADPAAVDKGTVVNYLDTPKALEDFADVLVAQAGAGAAAVREAWMDKLEANGVQMAVTGADKLFPAPVVEAVESAFKAGGPIWNLVDKTGLDAYNTAWDTNTDGALGHQAGKDKKEATIAIENRVLEGQYIYKYLTLDKETIRKNKSTGSLLRYVLQELPKRIIASIERAIVIGDGLADASDDKIKSFVSVKADAKAGNVFAKTYTPKTGESRRTAILNARDLIEAEGDVYIIAKRGYLTALKDERGTDKHMLYTPGVNILEDLELAGKFTPQWFNDTNDAENDAYLVVFNKYKVVGDQSIESYTNFALKQNKHEYLQEIFAGGGLSGIAAAVAIKHVA